MAAWLVGACLPLAALAQVQLPDFGDTASVTLSPADERELGMLIMRQVRATLPLVEDAEVEEYIQSLGYKLVSSGSGATTDFHFFVVAEPVVNAFALPGGYIGINSGLITSTESESELASVMAHEIAHVTQRHIARAVEAQETNQFATLAAVIAGLIIGAAADPQAGQAAVVGATAASTQSQINFTRANEKEADRLGIQMLAAADFDPRAMPSFFEKLDLASRYYTRPPEFLSTHPVTTSRIADSRGRAAQYPAKQYAESTTYKLVRAKLLVLTTTDPRRLLSIFDSELAQPGKGDRTAALYGRALVLAELGEGERARAELEKLVAADPTRVSFRVALAKQDIAAGRTEQGLAIFREAYGLFPDSTQLVRGYVDALVRTGHNQQAIDVLDKYSRIYAKDPQLFRLQAEAYRQLGKTANSRLALAEYYVRTGELDAGIHQLELAANESSGDFYVQSRIEARLQELERERQELVKRWN
ncbi:MAG: M48 family metalloprotease [Gammaproteobacteria bacterium]|nr:M48 family metalloprotease [Gammaproteobacteria bacterium]